MPMLNPAASERQFKTFARKAHKKLTQRGHEVPLAQLQEVLIQALGYAHLHAAKQEWTPAPVSKRTVLNVPPLPEGTDDAVLQAAMDRIAQMPLVVTIEPPVEEQFRMMSFHRMLERMATLGYKAGDVITVEGPPEMIVGAPNEAPAAPTEEGFRLQAAMKDLPSVGGALFVPCERHWGGDLECHEGVVMDADVYAEGWADDEVYPPCSCHPRYCPTCRGLGTIEVTDVAGTGAADCPDCIHGWRGPPAWPQRD